jgi:putative nucleotidyltransferase with HDIG domain
VEIASWAAEQARTALATLADRWLHTVAVASEAERLAREIALPDGQLLIAAAWLHDIGYAPELATTSFHSLDGALYLEHCGHHRLARLVANHTGALEEARLRRLEEHLTAFPDERSTVSAALLYCDLTCGPNGQPMSPAERRADVEHRHGSSSIVVAGLSAAWPDLMAGVEQVEQLRAVAKRVA